ELLLAAHQRIDMLDRRDVRILRSDGARDRNQGLTGGVGDEVQVKIIVRGRHKNSLNFVGTVCGFLWSLTSRKGMCDAWGGISADFLHTTGHQNKSGALSRGKRDCADNPFDKLPTERRKPLKRPGL